MPVSKFGERLRQARIEAGLNQRELGERLNVSDSYITNLEKGQRNVNQLRLAEITKVLGCSADYLLFGTQGYNERRLS